MMRNRVLNVQSRVEYDPEGGEVIASIAIEIYPLGVGNDQHHASKSPFSSSHFFCVSPVI